MDEILCFVVAYLTTISFLPVSFSLFFFSVSNAFTAFIHRHLLRPLSTFLYCRFVHWACALATELRCTQKKILKRGRKLTMKTFTKPMLCSGRSNSGRLSFFYFLFFAAAAVRLGQELE